MWSKTGNANLFRLMFIKCDVSKFDHIRALIAVAEAGVNLSNFITRIYLGELICVVAGFYCG